MSKEAKRKTDTPFIRAYNFVLKDPTLTPAEKLVFMVVCRYWPEPCSHTNKQIAEICAFSERWVETLLMRLKKKNRIAAGYTHTEKNGKPYTVRVIVPKKVKNRPTYHVDEQTDRTIVRVGDRTIVHFHPKDRSFSPEQSIDLQEHNKNEEEREPPTPSPVEGQASAAQKEDPQAKQKIIEETKQLLGISRKRKRLSTEELQARAEQQKKRLKAHEDLVAGKV